MKPAVEMKVRARIVGPIDGHAVSASGTIFLKPGATVKHLLNKADSALGLQAEKPFKRAFRQGIRPVVLLNGDRIELPEEKDRPLSDGDEISIILAVAGG